MNPSAVLKAFVTVSPAARAKALESKLAALDGRIDGLAVRAAEIDGGEDPAGVVAAAAAAETARAERVVLVRALETAKALVAEAAAAEAVRREADRLNALVAECESVGDELQAALVEVCSHLGRFTVLSGALKHANHLRFGLEHYCRAASAVACKDLTVPWGEERSYKRVVELQLTVPLVPNP